MTPTIRRAQRGDLAQIVAMAKVLTDHENRLPGADEVAICALTEEVLARHCFGKAPLVRALVAETEDGLAGYLLYLLTFDSMAAAVGLWMADLYVAPEARRGGVGRALLRALAAACTEHDATWLAWQVKPQNSTAQAFYDRFGERDPDLSYWSSLVDFKQQLT